MSKSGVIGAVRELADATHDCVPPQNAGDCRTMTLEFQGWPYRYVLIVWFDRDGRVERVEPVAGITG
jgi:hypothetical protein